MLSDKLKKFRKSVEKRNKRAKEKKLSEESSKAKEAKKVGKETKKIAGQLGFTRKNAGKAADKLEAASEGMGSMAMNMDDMDSRTPNELGEEEDTDEFDSPFSLF